MTPTRGQRLAAFEAAKRVIESMIEELVGSWGDVRFTDDEIHQISDAAVEAALNVNPLGENNE